MKPATGPSDLERWQAQPGDVLLVTDIQNDFLPGGSLAVAGSDEVVPVLNRYIEEFVARGLPVYATRDWHPERHCSFRAQGGPWPVHCVAGTHGNEFAANLVLPPDTAVISKATAPDREAYSGFEGTTLDSRLVPPAFGGSSSAGSPPIIACSIRCAMPVATATTCSC